MLRITGQLFLIILLPALLAGCGDAEPGSVTLTGGTMGTTWSVKLVPSDGKVDEAALQRLIDAELERINASMSTWIASSEISRFNAAPVGDWFEVSSDMLEVVDLAREIHSLSGGRFDVTIGPLVNLWGFGPDPSVVEVPPEEEIEAAQAKVGMDKLELEGRALRRTTDLYLDLSAIAKGYGVDRIAAILEREGIGNYLVEIGGELRASGQSPRGTPWRVGIERPDVGARVPFTALEVRNAAIATSGDYRNYFEVDGERYSHMINPVSGRPIRHNLASISVIAPNAARADGLATAMFIMGADEAMALAESQDIPVFAIIKDVDGFIERSSSAFREYIDP